MGQVIQVQFRKQKCDCCGSEVDMFDDTTCMSCTLDIASDLQNLKVEECPLVLARNMSKTLRT